ncbi:Las1-domain-containing protein [Poronia punctata]|nr:Las1-domain-containing protein [Poronia punctata]
MVQYIHTPWRDRQELLRVRQQFYPSSLPPSSYANAKIHADSSARTNTISTRAPSVLHHSTLPTLKHPTTTPNQCRLPGHPVVLSPDQPCTPPADNPRAEGDDEDAALVQEAEKRQQLAVSRVSMWMQRGGCPHMIESTALLTAAILSDLHESRTRANSSSYAIRAAYSAAFSRFVTGLLDGQQDKLRKMSMYSVAKTIGLPATFVELRHQATHEQLPSLSKLRSAASNALVWIWDFYWKDLTSLDENSPGEDASMDKRTRLLTRYLREQDETTKAALQAQFRPWNEASLLQTLAEIAESSDEPKVIIRALQLSRTVLGGNLDILLTANPEVIRTPKTEDLDAVRVELQTLNEKLQDTEARLVDAQIGISDESSSQSVGWAKYQGTWTPRPIGIV